MSMKIILAAVLFGVLAATGCASANAKMYDASQVRAVHMWYVGFNYEGGSVEHTTTSSGDSVNSVVETGMPRGDLQFRDNVLFRLKDKSSLHVTRDRDKSDGTIGMTLSRDGRGHLMWADVQLYSASGEVIGRIKATNGNRVSTYKNEDEFADYTADQIAKALH